MLCIINNFNAFVIKGCSPFLPGFHFNLCCFHTGVGNFQYSSSNRHCITIFGLNCICQPSVGFTQQCFSSLQLELVHILLLQKCLFLYSQLLLFSFFPLAFSFIYAPSCFFLSSNLCIFRAWHKLLVKVHDVDPPIFISDSGVRSFVFVPFACFLTNRLFSTSALPLERVSTASLNFFRCGDISVPVRVLTWILPGEGGVLRGKKDRDDRRKSKKTTLKIPSHKICAP